MKNMETLNKSLILAVQMGNLKAVQKAVNEGADINFQGANGQTALMRAILNQKEEVFHWLLSEKADVNIKDQEGKTALMMAYQMGLTDFAEELKSNGADETIKDIHGNIAQDYQLEETVGRAEPVNSEARRAQKLLMAAIAIESKEGIDIALKNGADLEYQNFEGEEGTPLLFATKKGNVQIISYLMERGAKADEEMAKIAAKQGNTPVLNELTKKGKQFFTPEVQKLLERSSFSPTIQQMLQDYEENTGSLEGKTAEEIQATVTQAQDQKRQEEVAKIEAKQEEIKKEEEQKAQEQKKEEKAQEEKAQEEKKEEQKEEPKEEKINIQQVMNTVFALKHEDDVLDIATKTGFKTIDGKEVQLTSTLAAQMMRMAKQKAHEEKDDEALLQSPTMWSHLMGFQNKADAVLIRTASTLLYLAGLQNKADVARQVFASYPEYFSKTNDKYGVLIESAYNGSSEVISECLAHGADLNPKYGTTPLDAAVEVGNEAMVKYFLSKGAVVSSGRNSEIITAAKYDHPNILDALLLRSKKDTTASWEAFAYGAQNGNKKTLEKLFKETDKMGISLIHSFTPPKKTWSEVYATGVLSNAVKAGHMDVIQMLINKGAKLEQKYTPNESLLVTAINHQKTDVVDLLLDNGADIQKFGVATIFNVLKRKDEKVMLNPVLMAAYNMDIPMIQHLVKKGADINSLTQNTGTVLDFYQKMGHFHLSEIDSSDQKGALLMAKYQKNFERGVEILKGLGAKTWAEMYPIKNHFNKFLMDRFKKTDKS